MIIRKYKESYEKQIVPLLKLVFPGPKYIDEKYWNFGIGCIKITLHILSGFGLPKTTKRS